MAFKASKEIRWSWKLYRKVDDRCYDEGPVAAEVRVGDVGADDGRQPHRADPVGDVIRRGDGTLMELVGQIQHQVWGDAIVRHSLERFIHCKLVKEGDRNWNQAVVGDRKTMVGVIYR